MNLPDNDEIKVYLHKKECRLMAYIKENKKVISYPRYIMEKELGRELLSNEEVHHKDGNPLNNDINNLVVLTKEEHLKLHAENNRKYHNKMMVCPWCNKEFLWTVEQQMRFYGNIKRADRKYRDTKTPFCSKSCAGKYGRKVQEQNGYYIGKSKRKLSDEQIRYIRNNYIPGDREFGGRALAKKFNISSSTLNDIVNGKTYIDCDN